MPFKAENVFKVGTFIRIKGAKLSDELLHEKDRKVTPR
jgi:hypothetical protein